ncbi:MAG: hypothetical protein O3C17_07565, partial [Planctomycetota bacterium]|nr:hypothetical protein [Planctomycetota bacterium]
CQQETIPCTGNRHSFQLFSGHLRGRRWDLPNAEAEAIAALTTLKDSGQWTSVWPTPDTAKT